MVFLLESHRVQQHYADGVEKEVDFSSSFFVNGCCSLNTVKFSTEYLLFIVYCCCCFLPLKEGVNTLRRQEGHLASKSFILQICADMRVVLCTDWLSKDATVAKWMAGHPDNPGHDGCLQFDFQVLSPTLEYKKYGL